MIVQDVLYGHQNVDDSDVYKCARELLGLAMKKFEKMHGAEPAEVKPTNIVVDVFEDSHETLCKQDMLVQELECPISDTKDDTGSGILDEITETRDGQSSAPHFLTNASYNSAMGMLIKELMNCAEKKQQNSLCYTSLCQSLRHFLEMKQDALTHECGVLSIVNTDVLAFFIREQILTLDIPKSILRDDVREELREITDQLDLP